jgi:hypothetical protein
MCIKASGIDHPEANVIRDMKQVLDRVCGKTECDWGCEGCQMMYDYTDCYAGVVGCQCLKNILNDIEARVE